MDRKDIENYIDKLKNIEKEISSEESEDISFVGELDTILSKLSNDITNSSLGEKKFNGLEIKIKKLHENAIIPTYSKEGDAGMDLTITSIISETTTDVTYGFGIAMEIPKDFVGLIFPRSSIRKYDLSLTNCVGVIDSGYRGELQATFKKTNWLKGKNSHKYEIGDRGSQIMILPYPKIKFVESEELSNSDRGSGGFGSTGV
jgi:dUTP pyrophosphatase